MQHLAEISMLLTYTFIYIQLGVCVQIHMEYWDEKTTPFRYMKNVTTTIRKTIKDFINWKH